MSEIKNDELILYDTKDASKYVMPEDFVLPGSNIKETITTFALVGESDPILKEVLPEFNFNNPPINPMEFASSLVETCKMLECIGLSANQCGFKHRVFVAGAGDQYVACFNPKLISSEGEVSMEEGCATFPFLSLKVTRPKSITIEYQDYLGNKHTSTFGGLSARIFQHELDHMNGILYTERVKPLALQFAMKKMAKLKRNLFKGLNSLSLNIPE